MSAIIKVGVGTMVNYSYSEYAISRVRSFVRAYVYACTRACVFVCVVFACEWCLCAYVRICARLIYMHVQALILCAYGPNHWSYNFNFFQRSH